MLPGAAFKVYVNVFVEHTTEGLMLPRTIVWEDGLKYDIDRVIDIRPAYAAKAGGQGDRYTIQVNGARTYILNAPPIRPTRRSGAGLLSAKCL